jgi:hypothetical protein
MQSGVPCNVFAQAEVMTTRFGDGLVVHSCIVLGSATLVLPFLGVVLWFSQLLWLAATCIGCGRAVQAARHIAYFMHSVASTVVAVYAVAASSSPTSFRLTCRARVVHSLHACFVCNCIIS